jgi:transcriptional regulator with XRE-family HTH domain
MTTTYKNEVVLAFTARLQKRLRDKGKTLSPTALAREFNLRWRGSPISVNATRKWLSGEAVPTLDKLSVLANLLDVSVDWLRWGDLCVQEPANNSYSKAVSMSRRVEVQNEEKSFAQDFILLNPLHKRLVGAVMEVLLQEQKKIGEKNR